MNPPSSPTTPQTRRWVAWLTIVLLVLFLATTIGWMFAKGFVESKIQTQLADLNLGETKIGGIRIGLGGVAARDIEFRFQPTDSAPWLNVGTLTINHPLSALAAGATAFNHIELNNAQANLSVDQLLQLTSAQGSETTGLDLSQLKLPAEKISVNDSNFHIQDGQQSLDITGVSLQIEQVNDTQNISGQIADLLGGQWNIDGKVDPAANTYAANISTNDLRLNNQQWQSLPYVPTNLKNYLTAAGNIDITAEIFGNADLPFDVQGSAKVKTLDMNLPTFDLPVNVRAADVTFDLEKITATNLVATIDGQDQISGFATTNISSWPITADFETQFKQLSVNTLRSIVPDIPEILATGDTGADGTAVGSINVAADMRTEIKIDAGARTDAAEYGDLQAAASQTTVTIESLVFDANQSYESINGSIRVDADAAEQPLGNIFSTFGIEALYQQLDLDGIVTGKAKLDLPLATIGDLKTWGLTVTGTMPKGKLAGQPIRDADVSGRLNRGVLELSRLIATAEVATADVAEVQAGRSNQLQANLAWPLVLEENAPLGTVVLSGQSLPTHWAVGLIQNQIFKATGEHIVAESSALAKRISDLSGEVNFDAQINIRADQPDKIELWSASGNIRDSKLIVQQQSLSNLSTNIRLADGKLILADVAGAFPQGGSLAGSATIDLLQTAQHQINIDAQKVPLLWLVTVGKNASPELAAQFDKAIGVSDDQPLTPKNTAGELDIKVDFATLPQTSPIPWNANLTVDAQKLTLAGNTFENLTVQASSNSTDVIVKRMKSNFGPRGLIDGAFNWNLQRNRGDGEVTWKSLPIQSLLKTANVDGVPITGDTDGKLKIRSLPADTENYDQIVLPLDIRGQIAAVDLTAAKLRVRPFKFDVATRSGAVHIENFRTENEAIDFDFRAQADLIKPFRFKATGAVARLQLSRLLKQSSVTQKEGEVADVSGVMSGKFQFDGQLLPLDLHTNGKIQITHPSYNNRPYQDIFVNWDHLGNDWDQSKLEIKAFGGEVEMVELTQKPQRVKVEITDIDAREVSSLFDLPLKLSGTLDGAASLNDWSLNQTRWAKAEMIGSAMLVSEIKIGDFTAKADYRSDKIEYGIFGALLGGKFEGQGEAEVGQTRFEKIEFPMEFTLTNALLGKLSRKSNLLRGLRDLDGNVSATAKLIAGLDRPFEGDGRIRISDAKWSDELLTRLASVHFNVSQGRLIVNDVQADLKRGSIKANAVIPLGSTIAGKYDCDIRQMDLARIAAVASDQPLEIEGRFDARLTGKIGEIITGHGYVGVDRASLHGVAGQSVQVPIQFTVSAASGSGRVELQRSTFRLFGGSVSGTGKMNFGSSLSVNSDLRFTRIDTGAMIRSLAGSDQADQGELNGRLKIKGSGVRSLRDLKGTFEGELERSSAFQLPVLEDLARALGGQVQNDDFSSQDIRLKMDNGRVEVKNLNLSSSLANVAITGFVFVDGRLDLDVAGQIQRINQPTLIEELAGSPLAAIRGTPASFFAQAAEFLSNRVVFLKVRGTANRPQVRVDTKLQLREEVIRYFLRGSQILPIDRARNN